MSKLYKYKDRELFESVLKNIGFSIPTISVYSSGIVNPKSGSHKTALNTWKRLMDGIAVPLPVDNAMKCSPRKSSKRPSDMEYNKPEAIIEEEEITPIPEPKKEEAMKPSNIENAEVNIEQIKINAIQSIIALKGIPDGTKVKMIALLCS